MNRKLKSLIALSLFIMLMFSLSVVALARPSNGDDNLHNNNEVGLAPDGIGLLAPFGVVTTTDDVDTNPGDGTCATALTGNACTLRAAIEEANAFPGDDTINVPAGTYGLNHANGDLDITSTLTISGAGPGLTIIDDNVAQRIFDIHNSGVATITGVTILAGQDDFGAGIRNEGTLLLLNSTVSGNTATKDGGGIFNDNTGPNIGDLTVTNSTITSNAAGESGGGIFNKGGTVTINSTTINLNSANADSNVGVGGGIANSADAGNDATLTINQSFITTNTVRGVGGGGISNSADFNRTATIILSKTLVSGNVATATTVDSTMGFGGGIRNGFFSSGNSASSAILTVNNSTISNNTAFNGGGIGSGTTIAGSPTLRVAVNKSTISGNTADGLTSNDVIGNGGGLINQNGTMNLVNSTVSGNTATGGTGIIRGYGGGIANSGFTINTTVALSNTTIGGNTAATGGNALANLHLGAATEAIFRNTIIAGGCANPILSGQGTLTSNGYNMEDGNSCDLTDPTDFTNTNPVLGPLQDNTGDTETHALLSTSPAIDSGICSGAPPKDQRDQARPNAISAFCDMGALESPFLGVADLEITKVVTPTQADPGQAITYTLTFINNGPAWAGNVVITDVVPLTVTGVASTSSGVTITATAGVTYSWTLGDLARGGSGTITITGLISPSVLSGSSFINTALITNVNDNDSDSATVAIGDVASGTYLPIIMKNS